jgi:hypothetical protein
VVVATRVFWAGWVFFAGLLMIVVGALEFLEGLIAVVRKNYYVVSPSQVIVFNVTTWGWITLLWGIVIVIAGLGLLSGAGWARWFTIVVGCLNFIVQLGFVGSSQYPLWALVVLALTFMVLYALIVRWDDITQVRAESR